MYLSEYSFHCSEITIESLMSHVIFTPITVLLDKYCIDYPIQWIRETYYIIFSYQTTSIIIKRCYHWLHRMMMLMRRKEIINDWLKNVSARYMDWPKKKFIELSCVRWNMRQQSMISSSIVFTTIDVTRSHSCFFLAPHLDVLTRNILFYSSLKGNYFFNQMLSK